MSIATSNVRVGVGVFILESKEQTDNPRFLVGKRLGSHGAGSYALPGGHLEFGETPEECAARECLEETGLEITSVQFLTATNDYMPEDNKHYVTVFMVCIRQCDNDQAEVLEPDKCESWEWASWTDLKKWVEIQAGAQEGQVLERKLFLPLINLVGQRPGVVPSLN